MAEDMPIASWRPKGRSEIRFPVTQIVEGGGRRLVRHARPGRRGVKLDDTGAKEREWKFTCTFADTIEEEGLDASVPIYPDLLNRLIESFDSKDTGDLVVPTIGLVRARAESYERTESSDLQNGAALTFTFVEDNEDAVDQAVLKLPTSRSSSVSFASDTTFTAESAAFLDEDLGDLSDFASDLQDLIAAPGRNVDDIAAQVRQQRQALQDVEEAGEALGAEVGGIFYEPEGSTPVRGLRTLSDAIAGSADERTASMPRLVPYVVQAHTDLFTLAAALGQDAAKLLNVNAARIADPMNLTPGDVIRIFAT